MTKEREKIEDDINYLAYKDRLASGEFDELEDDSFLAFSQGLLVTLAHTREEMMIKLTELDLGEVFMTEVRPKPIKLHGFFVDKDGGLHRGVVIQTIDEDGNEKAMGLDFGSNMVFPMSEDGTEDE